MKKLALLLLVLACNSSTDVNASLETEAAKLEAWASNAVLVDAVTAQNNQNLSITTIIQRDAAWSKNEATALVTATITGPCADQLRSLAGAREVYGEVLLMDRKGALVCATARTTDYWQGDEDKFLKSYNNGQGAVFIDEVRYDSSAGENLAQISLPVKNGTSVIGAITVGIRVNKL